MKIAKKEELSEMYHRSVWTEVAADEAVQSTGKPPIPVRWVIANRGDSKNYNVRARLVAKQIVAKYGGKGLHELFAAVPPFEIIKMLLRAGDVSSRARVCRKMIFLDVSKAHLYALVDADVDAFVELPPECWRQGLCGKLNYWLYGMRPASQGWENEYTKKLKAIGFE